MKYIWTEDKGAGFHFWQLVNQHLFQGEFIVESKESNQGLLDAVRNLKPDKESVYYIAFDMVYDNMDVVNKLLDMQTIVGKYPEHIRLLNITCFDVESIEDHRTLKYLMGFKHFSTERILKSITYELTDSDAWSIKGKEMGECWYKDCCVLQEPGRAHCKIELSSGDAKILTLLRDKEMQKIAADFED